MYSDHGQEEVVPYPVLWGRNLDEAIAEVFEQVTQGARIQPVMGPRGEQFQRARLLGGGVTFGIAMLVVTPPAAHCRVEE